MSLQLSMANASFGPASLSFEIPGLDDLPAQPQAESAETLSLRHRLASAEQRSQTSGDAPARAEAASDQVLLSQRLKTQTSQEKIIALKAIDARLKAQIQALGKLPARLKAGMPAEQIDSALEPVQMALLAEAPVIKGLLAASDGEALQNYARLQLERLAALNQKDTRRFLSLKPQLGPLETAFKLYSLPPLEKLAWVALSNSLQLALQAWFGLRVKLLPPEPARPAAASPPAPAPVPVPAAAIINPAADSRPAALRLPPLPLDKINDVVAVSRYLYKLRSELRNTPDPALREALSDQICSLQARGLELRTAQRCRFVALTSRQLALIAQTAAALPAEHPDARACYQGLLKTTQQRQHLQSELDKLCQHYDKARPGPGDFSALNFLQGLYARSLKRYQAAEPEPSALNPLAQPEEQTVLTRLDQQVAQLQQVLEQQLDRLEREQALWDERAYSLELEQAGQNVEQLAAELAQLSEGLAQIQELADLEASLQQIFALEQALTQVLDEISEAGEKV